ncbi:hypothetical protein AB836_01155 [Rickettsiales bacterium (ex Bugula neritina AB1)]|nr:hypothetical protein AB836_01155 [Rickettsiales bacterium (ex Bugula neritina AB1)]
MKKENYNIGLKLLLLFCNFIQTMEGEKKPQKYKELETLDASELNKQNTIIFYLPYMTDSGLLLFHVCEINTNNLKEKNDITTLSKIIEIYNEIIEISMSVNFADTANLEKISEKIVSLSLSINEIVEENPKIVEYIENNAPNCNQAHFLINMILFASGYNRNIDNEEKIDEKEQINLNVDSRVLEAVILTQDSLELFMSMLEYISQRYDIYMTPEKGSKINTEFNIGKFFKPTNKTNEKEEKNNIKIAMNIDNKNHFFTMKMLSNLVYYYGQLNKKVEIIFSGTVHYTEKFLEVLEEYRRLGILSAKLNDKMGNIYVDMLTLPKDGVFKTNIGFENQNKNKEDPKKNKEDPKEDKDNLNNRVNVKNLHVLNFSEFKSTLIKPIDPSKLFQDFEIENIVFKGELEGILSNFKNFLSEKPISKSMTIFAMMHNEDVINLSKRIELIMKCVEKGYNLNLFFYSEDTENVKTFANTIKKIILEEKYTSNVRVFNCKSNKYSCLDNKNKFSEKRVEKTIAEFSNQQSKEKYTYMEI